MTTTDDLDREFQRLAEADPEMRIDRSQTGDAVCVNLAPGVTRSGTAMFRALANDAAEVFGLDDCGDGLVPWERWVLFVIDKAPELVLTDDSFTSDAELDDGKRVLFSSRSIYNAAKASALVVRRCRDLVPVPLVLEIPLPGAGTEDADVDNATPPLLEGDWSQPNNMKTIAKTLRLPSSTRTEGVESHLSALGSKLHKLGRQKFMVRLDTLPQHVRELFYAKDSRANS